MTGILTGLVFCALLIYVNCLSNDTALNSDEKTRELEFRTNNFPGPWSQLLRKGINTISGIRKQVENNPKFAKNRINRFKTTTEMIDIAQTHNPTSAAPTDLAESINDNRYIPMCDSGTCFTGFPPLSQLGEIREQFSPPPFENDNRPSFQINEETDSVTSTTHIPILPNDEQIPFRPNINLFANNIPRFPYIRFPFNRFQPNPHIMNRGPIMALPFFTQLQMMPPQFIHPFFRFQPHMMAPSNGWDQIRLFNMNARSEARSDDEKKN